MFCCLVVLFVNCSLVLLLWFLVCLFGGGLFGLLFCFCLSVFWFFACFDACFMVECC